MSYTPAFPKPSQIRKATAAVKVFPSGREVCNLKTKAGADEYQRRKLVMWERQGRRCKHQSSDQCKAREGRWPVAEIVFGHESSRGLGGGTRDDRIEVNGKPHNYALCSWCNSEQGSKRISYSEAP